MSYHAGYDNYDPYTRPVSRAMSRRQSMSYPTTPYTQSMYGDEVPPTPFPGQQPYYGHAASAVVPVSRRLTGSYDNYDEPYYDQSMGAMNPAMGHAASMTSMMPRARRQSTVSFSGRPPMMAMGQPENYRVPGSVTIKFKRKGGFMGGIGLDEAQGRVKLSNNDHYSFHDLHADGRKRVHLRIKWTGYSSLTYEIPLDGYDGRVDLQTLGRRVSRACVHYLQANVIPVVWDRVVLHRLEEVSYGVWQPMLSMR